MSEQQMYEFVWLVVAWNRAGDMVRERFLAELDKADGLPAQLDAAGREGLIAAGLVSS